MASQPKAPMDETARLEFCKSVIDAIKPGDKLCGPYLSRLRSEAKARIEAEAKSQDRRNFYRSLDIQGQCKKFIGQIMGRPTDGMVATITTNDFSSASVAYMRDDDTFWMYECKTDGSTIVWRAIDTNVPSKGQAGRWREEDRTEINSF